MPAPAGSVFQPVVFQPKVFQKLGDPVPPVTSANPPIVYMMANMGSLMGR